MPLLSTRAILFDLDDTLIDFSGNQSWAWGEACGYAAKCVAGVDRALLHEAVLAMSEWYWSDPDRHRDGRRDLRAASAEVVRLAFARVGATPPESLPRELADYYRDLRDGGMQLFPGAIDLLAALRPRGIALALVTNGSAHDQRAKLERFDLARYFDHLQIEGEFGAGKPEEIVYREALRALDMSPAEATFVGDNLEWDVLAPARIGMRTIWVDAPGAGLPAGTTGAPTAIIRSVVELSDGEAEDDR